MKDLINVKIKFREPFRPFAPSVVSEKVEDYFSLPQAAKHYPARFMLYVVDVKEDKREIILGEDLFVPMFRSSRGFHCVMHIDRT
jgi:carbamoyltransferase